MTHKIRLGKQQIANCLRQAESVVPVEEITRKIEITQATLYRWKKKFAGIGVAELSQLKRLVAELSLDKAMLQDVLSKKPEACP